MKTNDFASPGADIPELDELKRKAGDYGLEYILTIPDSYLDASLVAKVPVEWVRTNCLLPVRIGGKPCVLIADPEDISDQEYLCLLLGEDLRPVLSLRQVILQAIERCYVRREKTPGDFLKDIGAHEEKTGQAETRSDDILRDAEETPVTQLVNLILLEAVKRRASDIHFEPFESSLRVRYRIDGVLYEQTSPPKNLQEALVSRLKVMARMDIAEKRLPQDGMAKVRVGEREIDIRVSTVPVAEGERMVLRLLDRDSSLLPLDVLGMSDGRLQQFESLLERPNGMIIVSGPTGSGKTTTLYAALCKLDSSRRNILTIEDPIEYQIPNIGQIQVKPKIGLTFATGLRHILRQDPDIVLVGETRDLETAEIAIRASLTGHLVLTTLHTNDAPGAVMRMVDMGIESYLISACVRGVLAQRLVRNLCPACRKKDLPSPKQLAAIGAHAARLGRKKVWIPKGCSRCLEGYKGRSGLFELLVIDAEIGDFVRRGGISAAVIREAAEKKGMTSMMADGMGKVLTGKTSLVEVVNALG